MHQDQDQSPPSSPDGNPIPPPPQPRQRAIEPPEHDGLDDFHLPGLNHEEKVPNPGQAMAPNSPLQLISKDAFKELLKQRERLNPAQGCRPDAEFKQGDSDDDQPPGPHPDEQLPAAALVL